MGAIAIATCEYSLSLVSLSFERSGLRNKCVELPSALRGPAASKLSHPLSTSLHLNHYVLAFSGMLFYAVDGLSSCVVTQPGDLTERSPLGTESHPNPPCSAAVMRENWGVYTCAATQSNVAL